MRNKNDISFYELERSYLDPLQGPHELLHSVETQSEGEVLLPGCPSVVPGVRVEIGPVVNLGQWGPSSNVHIGIQVSVSLSLAFRIKVKSSFWHAISKQFRWKL